MWHGSEQSLRIHLAPDRARVPTALIMDRAVGAMTVHSWNTMLDTRAVREFKAFAMRCKARFTSCQGPALQAAGPNPASVAALHRPIFA